MHEAGVISRLEGVGVTEDLRRITQTSGLKRKKDDLVSIRNSINTRISGS